MKKVSRILLVILLVFTSMGVTVNKHFCGEMLESIAINEPVDSCCEGAEMPKGCCHDEKEAYQLDEYKVNTYAFAFKAPEFSLPIAFVDLQMLFKAIEIDHSHSFNVTDPPPLPESDLLVEIQTFLL